MTYCSGVVSRRLGCRPLGALCVGARGLSRGTGDSYLVEAGLWPMSQRHLFPPRTANENEGLAQTCFLKQGLRNIIFKIDVTFVFLPDSLTSVSTSSNQHMKNSPGLGTYLRSRDSPTQIPITLLK